MAGNTQKSYAILDTIEGTLVEYTGENFKLAKTNQDEATLFDDYDRARNAIKKCCDIEEHPYRIIRLIPES